jgi:hypothetical protein
MKDKLMGKFISHKEENLGKKVEDMKDFIKKPKHEKEKESYQSL